MHRCWHTQRWVIVQFGSYGAVAELPVDQPINHSVLSLFFNYYSKLSSAKINLKYFLNLFIPGASGERGAATGLCAQICRPAELFLKNNFNVEKWNVFIILWFVFTVTVSAQQRFEFPLKIFSIRDSFLITLQHLISNRHLIWFLNCLFKEVLQDWLTRQKHLNLDKT